MKNLASKALLPLLATAVLAPNAFADSAVATGVKDALAQSKVNLNFRARYEGVDQEGKDNANALTLRSRITVNTGAYDGLSLGVEVDNITALVDDYNDLTTNYTGNEAVVADPELTDVNQAYLKYSNDKFTFKAGRQRINHDGQRFVGGVGWRQNEQTYDGYRIVYRANEKINFDYSYVYNINRIFGDESVNAGDLHGDFHLLNGAFNVNKNHKVSAFAYVLDFDTAAALSSSTYGLAYSGKVSAINLAASYAVQTDNGDNANDYSADYYNVEAGTKLSNVNVKVGIEVLGNDNGVGFTTPLATLHKFNGFADKFLSTPATGLQDVYLTVNTKVNSVKLVATYHDFSSDVDSIDYGTELDLIAAYNVNKHYSLLAKYATYSADDYSVDSDKLWLMVTAKF
jgi:hypothetical protein